MNVVLGLGALAAALYFAATGSHTAGFEGVDLLHVPALVLLLVGPVAVVMLSVRLSEWLTGMRALTRAFSFSAEASRELLYEDLSRVAAELRRRQPAAALEAADQADHELLRQLVPLVVKQYPAETFERTAATATACLASAHRRSEAIFSGLAKAAPAMGLVGTVLGLISLMRDLQDATQLGPSMALALLCTLYGLVLANAVYQPCARRLGAYTAARIEEARLITRALLLINDGRSLSDVRALFALADERELAELESTSGVEGAR